MKPSTICVCPIQSPLFVAEEKNELLSELSHDLLRCRPQYVLWGHFVIGLMKRYYDFTCMPKIHKNIQVTVIICEMI